MIPWWPPHQNNPRWEVCGRLLWRQLLAPPLHNATYLHDVAMSRSALLMQFILHSPIWRTWLGTWSESSLRLRVWRADGGGYGGLNIDPVRPHKYPSLDTPTRHQYLSLRCLCKASISTPRGCQNPLPWAPTSPQYPAPSGYISLPKLDQGLRPTMGGSSAKRASPVGKIHRLH